MMGNHFSSCRELILCFDYHIGNTTSVSTLESLFSVLTRHVGIEEVNLFARSSGAAPIFDTSIVEKVLAQSMEEEEKKLDRSLSRDERAVLYEIFLFSLFP